MMFFILALSLLVQLGAGTPVPVFDPLSTPIVPPGAVADYLNATHSLAWTSGTIDSIGTTFTMTTIPTKAWNAATAQVAHSLSLSSAPQVQPISTSGWPTFPTAKLEYLSWCQMWSIAVKITYLELMTHVDFIQQTIRDDNTPQTSWFAITHPKRPDVTLNYRVSVFDPIPDIGNGMIRSLFELVGTNQYCGTQYGTKGGMQTVKWKNSWDMYIVQAEFYATSYKP
jgi:hypothetical protein